MSDLELYLITTVVALSLTVIGFLLKEAWSKSKRNQERIDNSVVDTVSESKDRLNKIDTVLAIHSRDINGIHQDLVELKSAWKSSNEGMNSLNLTIQKFDNNARIQHQEMRGVLESNTKVMQEILLSLKK